MDRTQREAWNNRPTTTRVLEICPCCDELREHVKKRQIPPRYWYGKPVEITSCEPCYNEAAESEKKSEPVHV